MDLNNLLGNLKVDSTKCIGNGRGTIFHEIRDETVNKSGENVTGIMVRSGAILDAIGSIYGSSEVVLRGNEKGGCAHRIIFDEGDKLAHIEGVYDVNYAGNSTLSRLLLVTEKGKSYGPFGSRGDGQKFVLAIPDKARFEGFFGKANKVAVNALGLIFSVGTIATPDMQDLLNGLGVGGK